MSIERFGLSASAARLLLARGEQRDGLRDAALAGLGALGVLDVLDVLAAVRVAELVPSGPRVLVGLEGAREIGGRGDDARLVVALHGDGDCLAALDARGLAQ